MIPRQILRMLGPVAGAAFLALPLSVLGQGNPQPTPIPDAPNVIYRIDLEPTGTGFAMGKPVQQGDVWVITTLPDRTVTRVPVARVKKISRWSTDLNSGIPSGRSTSFPPAPCSPARSL